MKELYSFEISQDITVEEPYIRKTKKGEVEAFRKKKKKKKTRVIIEKPSVADIEKAEFFFGQKYNEYINAGFLTKAMLYKRFGEDGLDLAAPEVNKAISDYMEASRIIEFYEGAKKLDEDQKNKLQEAKETFARTQLVVTDHEATLRSQFSQTAEVKSEEKMIEWFIFNFSFYEDEVEGKKEIFPMFQGSNYNEKREFYLELSEDEEDIEDEAVLNVKHIFNESFAVLARVINIWYNKLGSNQKEIEEQLENIFGE